MLYRKPPKGKNPVGKDGRITRCSVCGSVNHWVRDCPDKDLEQADKNVAADREEVHVVLLNGILNEETGFHGIVDTACTSTLCGKDWLQKFGQTLPDELKPVSIGKSSKIFVFGGGEKLRSSSTVRLPIELFGNRCFVQVEVIDSKLPLLFSRSSLKRMGAVIDTDNDTISIFDGEFNPLVTLESGHYAVPLSFSVNGMWTPKCQNVVLKVDLEELSPVDIRKLHKQFCHCSSEKLLKLLKNAGYKSKRLGEEVTKVQAECDVCKQNKRNRPKPIVSAYQAERFNETVAMDLHQFSGLDKTWFLHIIDEFSRFSVAVIIHCKSAEVVVGMLKIHWILKFGPPERLRVDNGREFNNDLLRDLCEGYGIRLCPTPPYSPWSNGVCERHNAILAEMVEKSQIDDPTVTLNDILAKAVFAKNSLENHVGFTPFQLVFGVNPKFPTVVNSQISGLCPRNNSSVKNHFIVLENCRRQ